MVAGFYVLALGTLGGVNTDFGPFAVTLALVTTFFVAAQMIFWPWSAPLPFSARCALALIVLIPLAQSIPLPPSLWQVLPGGAMRRDALALVGEAGQWQPLSLAVIETLYTFVISAGFVTLTIVLVALDPVAFRRVAWLSWGLVAAGIVIGIFQLTAGVPVFSPNVDTGVLIGFFSNKNHMALAIAVSLPLARQLSVSVDDDRARIARLLFFAYWAIAMVAIIATASRAGLALGLVSSLAVILSLREVSVRQRGGIVVVAIVAAVLIGASAPVQALLDRFDKVGSDNRWQFVLFSLPLLSRHGLFGAGGGVFYDLSSMSEPLSLVKPTIINHVHNDYVEMVIEYGIPGLLALVTLVLAILLSLGRIGALPDNDRRSMRVAGATMVVLVALHSVVDYPLRRPAMLGLLAVALAMIWRHEGMRTPLRRLTHRGANALAGPGLEK